jgi:hypothetical protein
MTREALTLGEFMLRATRWAVRSDHIATARRARAVLGDAQVLIVLRNQADWLESWHLQGLKSGTKQLPVDSASYDLTDQSALQTRREERLAEVWE